MRCFNHEQSHVVAYPLISSFGLGVYCRQFFDTQVLSVSTDKLLLSRHAHCVFSRLHTTDTAFSYSLFSLELAEWRILHAASAVIRLSGRAGSQLCLTSTPFTFLQLLSVLNFLQTCPIGFQRHVYFQFLLNYKQWMNNYYCI